MDNVWATGRRHVKISKLYLRALLRRGPNIFVALAWSQVFWLVLEVAAGNEDSRGYVRLSSVACYALGLHAGGHILLFHLHRRGLSHHALEFLLDLVTDVVGFAWINLAEEMLAQVFLVTARTTLLYAVLAFAASLGAMEIGSCLRGFLDCPLDFDETANQFDAGSFALPTSWLVTQAVHIALYGFFYRTSAAGGQGGRDNEGGEVDVRLAASLFLLVYALLCSTLAARVLGGTVAAAAVADNNRGDEGFHGAGHTVEGGDRSELMIRAVEAGGPFTAAQASDAVASPPAQGGGPPRGGGLGRTDKGVPLGGPPDPSLFSSDGDGVTTARSASNSRSATLGGGREARGARRPPGEEGSDGEGSGEAAPLQAAAALFAAAAVGAAETNRARRGSLRRGLKAYMRITVGMMVGWAYNLWGQVEFRQEELEFRFGPALGATVYAALSTALGVCIMVRGADKLDGRGPDRVAARGDVYDVGLGYGDEERGRAQEKEAERYRGALRAFHAKRMLVVVGGVSLMVGWAWEEAIDLMLEGLVGDSADAGMVVAKLALAALSMSVVLGRELRAGAEHGGHEGIGGAGHSNGFVDGGGGGEDGQAGSELLEPLMVTAASDAIQ